MNTSVLVPTTCPPNVEPPLIAGAAEDLVRGGSWVGTIGIRFRMRAHSSTIALPHTWTGGTVA